MKNKFYQIMKKLIKQKKVKCKILILKIAKLPKLYFQILKKESMFVTKQI